MRGGIKILLGVIIAVAVIAGGFYLFLTSGMDQTANLVIGEVDASDLADGVYEGAYDGARWSDSVRVTVKDGKITDVEVVETPTFSTQETINELTERVIAAQSTGVDVVSGATLDSKALLKAVENALRNAG
jgi:uncharacterized protein with FMN-binding domain